ncbi:hypothetical protein BC830DRAFT_1223655 [Chytriomyces sp. MP71]|nr:hypothetical protein BC830DRAFT_1223655 [Chytriomyces sp. MP71]
MKPKDYHWAHAVNSLAFLEQTLADRVITAIEADVIYSDIQQRAVMGHPPHTDSDLTLDAFLSRIGSSEAPPGLIVKLDFKSDQAFTAALDTVASWMPVARAKQTNVFVNADILQGPGGAVPKFDALKFVKTSLTRFGHDVVLSLGWTTGARSASDPMSIDYSIGMVDEMLRLTQETCFGATVTFAVRAVSVIESWEALARLLDANRQFGFTLWYPSVSHRVFDELVELLESRDDYRNRTYYDMGFSD